jgi:hypothetical protein
MPLWQYDIVGDVPLPVKYLLVRWIWAPEFSRRT